MAPPTRPGQLRARQLAQLRQYLLEDVHPFVERHRRALAAAGIDEGRLDGLDQFRRLPTTTLDELGTGHDLLIDPTPEAIRQRGPAALRAKAWWSTLIGQRDRFEHDEVGPRYRPVLWTRDHQFRTGWSAGDLRRLGGLGRQLLARAGVRGTDRLLTVGLDADRMPFWELSLGARDGGVSAMHLRDPERRVLVDGAPTVVAGQPRDLELQFDGAGEHGVHTVLVVGPPLPDRRRASLAELTGAEIVHAWAPPGVRSLWSERRGGRALVTDPDADLIEVLASDGRLVGDGVEGEVVWSGIGWAGTAVLRLRTGVRATTRSEASGSGAVAVTLSDPAVVDG